MAASQLDWLDPVALRANALAIVRSWFPRTQDKRGGFRPGIDAAGGWVNPDEREIVCT
jgi:hypothetical protein